MNWIEITFIVCLCIVFYTYIGYGIILWLLVKVKRIFVKRPQSQPLSDDDFPEATLLIAAYNEELIISEKMANTTMLDYPKGKLKVVWVTDGSNDGTNALLKEYENITVLFKPERKGKTAALNRSIPFIDTPIVVFTDANTMLNRNAIKNIAACFIRNPRVGCVAGEKRIATSLRSNASTGGEGMYWKYYTYTVKSQDWELVTTEDGLNTYYMYVFQNADITDDLYLNGYVLGYLVQSPGTNDEVITPLPYTINNKEVFNYI